MTTKGYKEKIQLMQQLIDRQEEQIQYLNNELFLCKESKKEERAVTKGNSDATPRVKFESANVATVLKGRIKAMQMYTEKKRDE